jgi:hypothetical protein
MTLDTRYILTVYGIYTDDWNTDWGGLSDHKYHLVRDYVSDAASCTSTSVWNSDGVKFIYPFRIKQKYFIEGVIDGQITFVTSVISSQLSDYVIQLIKLHEDTTETVLATTGTISVNDSLPSIAEVDTEIVYPFWIDVTDAKAMGENERIVVKVLWDTANSSTVTADISHWNWPSTEDIKINIPLVL